MDITIQPISFIKINNQLKKKQEEIIKNELKLIKKSQDFQLKKKNKQKKNITLAKEQTIHA